MGYASRAARNPSNTGIKPKTESFKKGGQYELDGKHYKLAPNFVWDPVFKKLLSNGKNRIERKKVNK